MVSAFVVRQQIEAALAKRIPSALTPAPRIIRSIVPTGIVPVDEVLDGGLPVGAITEMVGAECSGRTGLALSFLAGITKAGKVCAWVDVSDRLQPESAAATGVDLARLLWVRCGVIARSRAAEAIANRFELPKKYFVPSPVKKGLHGGGFGPHPRTETKGLSDAISGFLNPEVTGPRCVETQRRARSRQEAFEYSRPLQLGKKGRPIISNKPWMRMEQALRVTDLLLQAGGFSAIVLDMGSIAPEYASRVPLATWFRYRAAAERSQTSILLLTQHACAKSSAGLVLRFDAGRALCEERTVFTGAEYCVAVDRERFMPISSNVIPMRKPPQNERNAQWQSRAFWAGWR
jgi:recombination protein RecA